MIQIISGTNRKGSRTLQVAKYIHELYNKQNVDNELMDLAELPFDQLAIAAYGSALPKVLQDPISRINTSNGLVIVCPEYNGSMPGALKLFIDHWSYPISFESRPVCFVGLGFRWGGLRPVEHLQGVFGYRNAFIFPERVFIPNISENLKDGQITSPEIHGLLEKQSQNFTKFIGALRSVGLSK
jgi:chromate reductase